MTNKEHYREFCKDRKDIPIFSQPFWLDAVAENWDACFTGDASAKPGRTSMKLSLAAALPYCWKGNLLTKRIYLPDLSFYQPVLFFADADKRTKQKTAEALFRQLPATVKSYFKLLPEHSFIELSKLKYIKEDYSTYIIRHQDELSLSTNHKRNIQKGIKQNYICKESSHIEASFELLISTFSRQQIKPKITLDDFKKINRMVKKHNAGKTIDCLDREHNLLASAFIVADEKTAYYLFGGYNMAFKNSGAMTFLLHDAIQAAQQQHKDFNFCGSSKKSIAAFFEGFGGKINPVPIWRKELF